MSSFREYEYKLVMFEVGESEWITHERFKALFLHLVELFGGENISCKKREVK